MFVTRKRVAESIVFRTADNHDIKAKLIADFSLHQSVGYQAEVVRRAGPRRRQIFRGGKCNIHASLLNYREIHPERLFAAHQRRRRRRLRGNDGVFVRAETVSSCHLSVPCFYSRARSLYFIFFWTRTW